MKKLPLIASCFFVALFCFNAFGQDDGFYQADALKGDFRQVNAVAYVNVKTIKVADSMGSGDCEKNKGAGYCLYELSADVKEVFKGKIAGRTLKFYTSPDADYPKEKLMGEQVVFLNKNNVAVAKTNQFVTLENSTRKIEFDVIGKLRKIKKSVR